VEEQFLRELRDLDKLDQMEFDHQNPEPSDLHVTGIDGSTRPLYQGDHMYKAPKPKPTSPFTDDSATRKEYPVYSGFINYFPDAVLNVWLDKIPDDAVFPDAFAPMVARGDWMLLAKASLIQLEYELTGAASYAQCDSLYDFLMQNKNAVAALCNHSKKGNDKHNPGEPLHWSRDKSNDHEDCIARHLIDQDWLEFSWRCFAKAQIELEEAANEQFTPDFDEIVARMQSTPIDLKALGEIQCILPDDQGLLKEGWVYRYHDCSLTEGAYLVEYNPSSSLDRMWFPTDLFKEYKEA
jgi:hypothetical protein